MFQNLFL